MKHRSDFRFYSSETRNVCAIVQSLTWGSDLAIDPKEIVRLWGTWVAPFWRAVPILCVFLAGCGSSPTAPSGVPFSVTDLTVGTGAEVLEASYGQWLTVDYSGWLYDSSAPDNKGAMFDTTEGESAFTFRLGSGQVLTGWEQGVVGMRVGGHRRLVIPPELGYGGQQIGNKIPSNSTLIFEIVLLAIQ